MNAGMEILKALLHSIIIIVFAAMLCYIMECIHEKLKKNKKGKK